MPLFALSGTIISAGFIFLLNLVALNFVWKLYHPMESRIEDKVIAAKSHSSTQTPFFDKRTYRLTETEIAHGGISSSSLNKQIADPGRTSIPPWSCTPFVVTVETNFDSYPVLLSPFLHAFSFRGPPTQRS